MTTEYSIYDTHIADYLSRDVSETLTIGNTGLATTIRMYDNNAPLDGYLVTTSNGIYTINEANNSIPTCVGIGTDTPNSVSTLHVQGLLYTSNIRTYNTNNTLYFNNNNLAGINNINVQGSNHTIGNGTSTLTLGDTNGGQELILADVPSAQWKMSTSGYNLNFLNDYPIPGQFNTSRFNINYYGAILSGNNLFDDGNGNMNVSQNLVTSNITISNNLTISSTLTISSNMNVTSKLTSQNIVCGSIITPLDLVNNTLSFSMSNTYNVYSCSTNSNIQALNISNDIAGSQAVIFVTATGTLNIYGSNIDIMGGSPSFKIANTPFVLNNGSNAIINVLSSGTMRFVNCVKYI